jgi:5'-3' exonuclease
MKALFDADWIVYRSCFSKGRDLIQILELVDFYIQDTLDKLETDDYQLFLTGSTNFRKDIATIQEYKGNRKQPKPPFYHEVREYLVNNWNAIISDGMEADDLCGMNQTEDSIIVGEDKDLLMIPGNHYRIKKNWQENYRMYISEDEAKYNFFKQLVIGDRGDNIPKIPKIGEKKVSKILEGKNSIEMKETVEGLYKEHFGDDWHKIMDEVARLLWIKRDPELEYFHYIN